MHSSTSSSEAPSASARPLSRASVTLLAGALLLGASAELGTRAFVHDLSTLLNRLRHEAQGAKQLRPTVANPRPLLLVGNSLLVAGVDVTALDTRLRPDLGVSRFAVENTTYHDWYYGVRRILGDGARPAAVVLCLEVRHLLGRTVRDEIFAHYLMRKRDLVDVARAVDLSPTAASELFFANVSDFWGLRKEIRKNLLGRLLPGLPSLTALMTRGMPAPPADTGALRTTGAERLRALRSVGEAHDVRLVLALTPPLAPSDADFMRKLGLENRVLVLAPLSDTDLQPGDFDRDGYHLSAQGRARYTAALARDLAAAFPRP